MLNMKKFILISLLSFFIGGVVTYIFSMQSLVKKNLYLESAYLISVIKTLSKTENSNRLSLISQSPIFHGAEEIKSLSDRNSRYFVFSWTEIGLENIGLDAPPKASNNFYGFYILLDMKGNIRDFGFHKP